MIGCNNTTIRLDENAPQLDVLLRIETEKGGQARISEDDYIEGVPELVVEIASSSASYDLYDKKQAYLRNGVQEYIAWLSEERSILWFTTWGNEYVALELDVQGIVRSQVFLGIRLDVDVLPIGSLSRVLDVLMVGIELEAH